MINKLDIDAFRRRINEVEPRSATIEPLLVFDNHDNPRVAARYGDGATDLDIERIWPQSCLPAATPRFSITATKLR